MQAKPQARDLSKLSDYRIFIPLGIIYALSLANSNFLGSSFWLDECISAWISSGGLNSAISRSWQFQGQSPFYYIILCLWFYIFGNSEIAARALSFLLLLPVFILLFTQARKSFSISAAFLSCFLFICNDSAQLALNARPYALGILLSTLAIFFLLRFIQEDNPKNLNLILSIPVFGSLTIYAHYFAALSIVSAFFCVLTAGGISGSKRGKLLLAFSFMVVLCLPLLPHLQMLRDKSAEIAFAPPMTLIEMLAAVLPLFPTAILLIACLCCASFPSGIWKNFAALKQTDRLIITVICFWLFLPSLLLMIFSAISGTSLLLPRYLSFSAPAFAILAAMIFSQINKSHQRAVALVMIFLFITRELISPWASEDWREAIRTVQSADSTILVASGLAESNQISWLTDNSTELQQYLVVPAAYYKPELPAVAVPNKLGNIELKSYALAKIEDSMEKSGRATIVFHNSNDFRRQLSVLLSEHGFSSKLKKNGLVGVIEIEASN